MFRYYADQSSDEELVYEYIHVTRRHLYPGYGRPDCLAAAPGPGTLVSDAPERTGTWSTWALRQHTQVPVRAEAPSG